MVRTDQMWRYPRTVKIGHYHGEDEAESFSMLLAVTESPAQGWDFHLECGCKLQSCFGETEIAVEMNLLDEVANWGR